MFEREYGTLSVGLDNVISGLRIASGHIEEYY